MTKEEIQKRKARIAEINAKLAENTTNLRSCTDVAKIEELSSENAILIEERGRIIGELRTSAANDVENGGTPETPELRTEIIEKRVSALNKGQEIVIPGAEVRSLLMGATAQPTKVKSEISNNFETVPSIINDVDIDDVTSIGEYVVSYIKSNAEADEGTDGEDANESDPDFGDAKIKPHLVNVVTYVSKHLSEVSPVAYYNKVLQSVTQAIRRKVAALVTNGNGTDFYGMSNAIDKDSNKLYQEVEVEKIDETTLRDIVLGSYGGDDLVPGSCTLYLNKKHLVEFGKVRGTNEKKAIYEIAPNQSNPNEGIIKEGGTSVRYVLNSKLAKDKMLYGNPKSYTLNYFSNIKISTSKDEKFSKGLISVLAETNVGGNMNCQYGMAVITVKSLSTESSKPTEDPKVGC